MVDIYYDYKNNILKNKLSINDKDKLESAEADIISLKIKEIEFDDNFELSEEYFKYIHKFLFEDLFDFAGSYRKINMEKNEFVLGGLSVKYEDYENIQAKINNVIEDAKKVDINKLSVNEKVGYFTDLMIDLWKVHAFREGNTRTVIIFVCKYLENLDIFFKNEFFKENASYVRKSLVAASFEDKELDVYANKEYILKIMKDVFSIN